MGIRHVLSYALRGIRRGGQRVWVALLSVTFGVMSLYAMTALSQAVMGVLLVDPHHRLGGDAHLWREAAYLTDDDVAAIRQMQAERLIADYALLETPGALALKVPGSGRVTFLHGGTGFQPGAYPLLMGEFVLSEPAGAAPEDVLLNVGDVILTHDIVNDLDLHLGDELILSSRLGGRPVHVRLAGVATITPGYRGESVFYSLETAAMASQREKPYNTVVVTWGADPAAAIERLQAAGWQMDVAGEVNPRDSRTGEVFDFMLKGAGILGLLVGGIGIANTMQVLLARRKEEVAILKTLGYSRRNMVTLFAVETAILGLVGSLLGVGLGIGLSWLLVDLSTRIVTLYIPWRFDPELAVAGLLVGVVTTVLFAMNAILRASEVRPALLFRHMAVPRRSWLRSLGVFALMALPFSVITSLILESVIKGVGILLIALGGLIALGLLLGGLMWLTLRLLPTFNFHLLRMARNNLRRRGFSLIFAMIALFTGVFALGFSFVVISSAQQQLEEDSFSLEGINLVVLADPAQEQDIYDALRAQGVGNIHTRYMAAIDDISQFEGRYLEARNEPWDVTVSGAPWGTVPDGAYLPADRALPDGTTLELTGDDGQQTTVVVVGSYEPIPFEVGLFAAPDGVLVDKQVLLDLSGGDHYFMVGGEADPGDLTGIRDAVGLALPETSVVTSVDVNSFYSDALHNLFIFAVAMAGLALVAGGVLIANAVSLAMIERRYEIGVMKAMGYTRGHVLRTFLLEYGLVGGIASAVGLLGVEVFLVVLQIIQEQVADLLHVSPASGLLIVTVGVALTLLSALGAAWQPTRLPPLVVLNENA